MAKRTKQEVRNWLNSQVGKRVRDKSDARLDGQCVALIKALFEYLGVKDPYAARGNARDAGDSYLREGIAKPGRGWLTIVVNRDMAAPYGHIWIDLQNEANFEQNGATALRVTKGTRPYSQRQQVMNLDHLLGDDREDMITRLYKEVLERKPDAAGMKHYLTGYSKNMTEAQIRADMKKSAEYKRLQEAKKPKTQTLTVKSGEGLSHLAKRAGYGDWANESRWSAIAKLNGSSNWRTYNNSLKTGQKVRVK